MKISLFPAQERKARASGGKNRGLCCGLRLRARAVGMLMPALVMVLAGCVSLNRADHKVSSPDQQLTVEFKLNSDLAPVYTIVRDGKTVLGDSRLGLIRDDEDFSRGLVLAGESGVEAVKDDYEMLTSKRRVNHYRANRKTFHLATAAGKKLDIIFQVSNDGVAFRYRFPEASGTAHQLKAEVTSFKFPPGTRAWLQPMSAAKSGWKRTNPSYEEYYEKDIPAGTPSSQGAGWVFPGLFRSGETWVLLSETGLGRSYCGSRLAHASPEGEYSIAFADPRETRGGLPANPSSTLPWASPWRLVAAGSLQAIAESTLGVDLADPPAVKVAGAIQPGKASWSWPLLGDDKTVYDVQKRFVDYAADMGWAYCLVDALWDTQIGYDKIKELAGYAQSRNVGLLLWYNSNGDWNEAPQTPRDKLLTRESRAREFERLKAMGIRGLKVDFFGGDGQPVIDYYHDLLEESAARGLLMNFHGATLPRGWQRTYPHLMTMEAIRGFEYVTFEQGNADREAGHCAMLPFTRNVFDPMDFTPVCLDKIGRVQRRTTPAFELALAVLFTSGIQHYAEIPEGMARQPAEVKDFLKTVPPAWDDTRFIDGYPGSFVVMARQGQGRWYVAGINGENAPRTLTLDLSRLSAARAGSLITDGDGQPFQARTVELPESMKMEVTLRPQGGFTLVLPGR